MRLFSAIWRRIKAVGYLLAGKVDEGTKGLNENPHVVRAEYDEIVEQKTRSVRQARDAIAGLMRHYEDKVAKLEDLKAKIDKQDRLMNGARAMARKVARGRSKEEAQQDPEFVKCMKAYADFKSTLDQMRTRQEELQADTHEDERRIKGYEVQLQSLHRDLERLKEEREESVAGVVMAAKDRELNETLAGIGQDNTAERLQGLRNRVRQAQAEAKVTAALAGADTARQEAEFLELAGTSEAEEEFLADVFPETAEEKEAPAGPAPEAAEKSPLPD